MKLTKEAFIQGLIRSIIKECKSFTTIFPKKKFQNLIEEGQRFTDKYHAYYTELAKKVDNDIPEAPNKDINTAVFNGVSTLLARRLDREKDHSSHNRLIHTCVFIHLAGKYYMTYFSAQGAIFEFETMKLPTLKSRVS